MILPLNKFAIFGIFAVFWLVFVLFKRPSSRVSLVLGLLFLASGIPLSLLRKHAEGDLAMIYAFFLLGVGIFQEAIRFILNPPQE